MSSQVLSSILILFWMTKISKVHHFDAQKWLNRSREAAAEDLFRQVFGPGGLQEVAVRISVELPIDPNP